MEAQLLFCVSKSTSSVKRTFSWWTGSLRMLAGDKMSATRLWEPHGVYSVHCSPYSCSMGRKNNAHPGERRTIHA